MTPDESEVGDGTPNGGGSPNGDTTDESTDVTGEFPSIGATTDEAATSSDEGGEMTVDEGDASAESASSGGAAAESAGGEGLGWRGWVVVGALVVAMVLVPWALVFLPEMQGFVESLGLGLRDAYLVLPMVPALGLGILAVWAAIASRRPD